MEKNSVLILPSKGNESAGRAAFAVSSADAVQQLNLLLHQLINASIRDMSANPQVLAVPELKQAVTTLTSAPANIVRAKAGTIQNLLDAFPEYLEDISKFNNDNLFPAKDTRLFRSTVKKYVRYCHRAAKLTWSYSTHEANIDGTGAVELSPTTQKHLVVIDETGAMKSLPILPKRQKYLVVNILDYPSAVSTTFYAFCKNFPKYDSQDCPDEIITTSSEQVFQRYPELHQAYLKTEELITSVQPMVAHVEDEHFISEIRNSYYPSMLNSLSHSLPKDQKETLMLEHLEQFNLIQHELDQMLGRAATEVVSASQVQTAFLREKILGGQVNSLTSTRGLGKNLMRI